VDPWSQLADYSALPKADLILITHDHGDHLDVKAVAMIRKTNTEILCPEKCAASMEGAGVMKNGDKKKSGNILVEAVPAYNLVHKSQAGQVFHQKGEGNGYVITLGGKRIYVAGDTENTPEMKALKNIDAAFLPMNLPYTMTPAMVADAAGAFKPKILYPYHFGDTDTGQLLELMKDEKGIEIRLRKMK
jgi:L-ascorbate metabolism protein UlaG (beta-lactamase superfamily)